MSAYCDTADLYSYGLQRGALPNPGRIVDGVSVSANTVTLNEHGFELNDPVVFRAENNGSLPAPLVEGTTYYAVPVNSSVFSVAETADGSSVDLTTTGSRIVVAAPLPFGSSIAWASALVEDMLPAHIVPLSEPYPPLVRMTVAELAAGKLMTRQGAASVSLSEMVEAAQKRLERWAKGIPLRGENVPLRANLSVKAAAAYRDTRGWHDRETI